MLSKDVSIFFLGGYGSTWNWTPDSQTIGKILLNVLFYIYPPHTHFQKKFFFSYIYKLFCYSSIGSKWLKCTFNGKTSLQFKKKKWNYSHQWSGRWGSISGQVIPKTQIMVLDAALLNTQHYKIRIKGKVGQFREWSSTLPYTSV